MTLFSRLAAYYPCDNTHGRSLSEDVVGANNGTAGVVSAATGKVRQGMFFLSSGSQFRSVPNDSAIQAMKGLCCWVKFSTLATDQSIISKGSDGTDANTSLKLWYDHSDTDLAFTVGDGSTSTTIRTDGITLAVDTWYHVRCFNDGNRMGIAVNGVLYGSGTARAPLTETGLLYLGRDFSGNYFDGVLDEVALFSVSPTIADGAALYNGGSGMTLPVLDNLTGPTGRAGAGTRWNSPSFAESNEAVVYMAHGKLPVQRFDGTLARAGVEAPDSKVTIKSSGSGSLTGKRYAYLRNLDATGRVSSVSPLSDVHDTFGTVGAAITGATNASPIVITSASHGLTTSDKVRVTGQLGNTAANGTWTVTVLTTSTFSLNGSVGNGDWTATEPPGMTLTVVQEGSAGVNQIQTLSYSNTPTDGEFTLSFLGEPTTTIAYNASPATIQAALRSLTTVGTNVTCGGGSLDVADVTVTFTGTLGVSTQPLLEIDFTGAPSILSATVTTEGGTGNNEVQEIDLLMLPTGGTFTVTYSGQTTSALAYNASAATVQTALEALSNLSSGDVSCTGGDLPGTNVAVEFTGTLELTDVAEMTINPASLTGVTLAVTMSTPTAGQAAGDLTTLAYASDSLDYSSENAYGYAIQISSDGTNVFLIGAGGFGTTYKYTLSTPYDLSSASYTTSYTNFNTFTQQWLQPGGAVQHVIIATSFNAVSFGGFSASSQYTFTHDFPAAHCLTANADGTKFYASCYGGTKVAQFNLSTGWDWSTASFIGTSPALSPASAHSRGICFRSDGLRMYGWYNTSEIRMYPLSTAWDISTISESIGSDDVSNEIADGYSISIGENDEELFLGDRPTDTLYRYSMTAATNETQRITITGSPVAGAFRLTYAGQQTGEIAYNASAATVDTALEALSNIGAGDVTCTGGALPGSVVDIEFTGALAETNVAAITVTPASAPTVTITTDTAGVAGTSYEIATGVFDDTIARSGIIGGANTFNDFTWATSTIGMCLYNQGSVRAVRSYTATTARTVLDGLTQYANALVLNSSGSYSAIALVAGGYSLVIVDNDQLYLLRYDVNDANDRYDASNYVSNGFGDISGECTSPRDMVVDEDEGKIYVLDSNGTAYQYAASQGLPDGLIYENHSFDFTSEDASPKGIEVNEDGTKFYMLGNTGNKVYQYTASTPWRISTCTYDSVSMATNLGTIIGCTFYKETGSSLSGSHLVHVESSRLGEYDTFSAGTNESQSVSLGGSPTAGTFTLTYSGQTTTAIAYNATAATVDAALEALSNIGSGDVTCTNGPLPGINVDVEFTASLSSKNVAEMTGDADGMKGLITTTTAGTQAVNQIVSLETDVPAGTGTFTLTFGGQTTPDIAYDASAATIEENLLALSTVGEGNLACTSGPIDNAAVVVTFGGTLASQDVGAITATSDMTQTSPVLNATVTTTGFGGRNEKQRISVDGASGGTWTSNYSGQTTAAIQFDATASEVQQAIEALSTTGNGNISVIGGPLTEASLFVEFTGTLGNTNVDSLTLTSTDLRNGGWAQGANMITYTDVDVPTSTNVTRRQILRSKPGDANVFYIDIDEEDVVSNTFSSTLTDDELTSDLAVVMIDSNGADTNLSRHGVPPNYKRVVTSYQNRLFYGVDYVERSMVTISGDAATGVATDWPGVFDSRTLYDDTGKAIVDVDASQQTATLSESTATEQEASRATIRQGGDDSQRVYHSALTAIEALPESVHPNQSFLISRSDRDGDMAGQFNFDGQNYVAFQSAIYRYVYNSDPASAPDGDGRMQLIIPRGVCNNRTVAFTDDLAFCVDREGAYLFDGDTLESVSGPIKPMFSGRGGTRINWKHQDNFHAAYFSTERTVRFFVTLDGGPYPRHALCWNVDQRFWWIEKFTYPIVSSTVGVLDGKSVVFLGSTGRRVFTMTGTREVLGRNVPGSLRGTATSADTLSVTDTAAAFSSSLLGSTVTIVSGTGRGQVRRIVEVAATKLTVHEEWGTQPSTDSVYQLAAVNWSVKTGKLRFEQSNEKELRRLEMFWEPLSNDNSLDYQLYLDFRSAAIENERTLTAEDSDGIATTEGTAYNSVDLTERGHVEQDFGGMRQEGVSGDKFLTIEVEGSTNDEQLRLLGIAVSGAE
jgi:hypothetical protein